MTDDLTQEKLKEQLHYNNKTGIFTRLISNCNRVKIGDVAGDLNETGYVHIMVLGKTYKAHRLAWFYVYGEFPNKNIDIEHKDTIRNHNWIDNLRTSTRSENKFNVGKNKNNKCGQKGCRFHNGKYEVEGMLKGKKIYLGRFDTLEQASAVYQEFAKQHHGEFLHQA